LTSQVKACRLYGAKLVMAKIDRLSRDALFLLGLEKAGVDFVAAEMPNAKCLLLAQSGHRDTLDQCPLLGGKADIDRRSRNVRSRRC
jgi:hypothetical protein